jgi:polar amino acid transport system substrate-binding protein
MKKLLVISLVILVSISFGLAKTYKVGTSADFPPFEYVEDGEYVGFDMDLIRAIADEADIEIEIVDMSFDSLIAALMTGNLDIVIAGMTITEEREDAVDFTDPYWTADQSVVVKEDSGKNLTVLFGDNKIGAQTGTTGDIWVEENLVNTGILKGQFKRYETFVLAMTDLVNGNVDGVVLDAPVAERYAKIRPVKIVGIIKTYEEYGIAVREGNTELLEKLNVGLEKVRESGKMDELIGIYFE